MVAMATSTTAFWDKASEWVWPDLAEWLDRPEWFDLTESMDMASGSEVLLCCAIPLMLNFIMESGVICCCQGTLSIPLSLWEEEGIVWFLAVTSYYTTLYIKSTLTIHTFPNPKFITVHVTSTLNHCYKLLSPCVHLDSISNSIHNTCIIHLIPERLFVLQFRLLKSIHDWEYI